MADLWWDESRRVYYRDIVDPNTVKRERYRFSDNEPESLAAYYTLLARLDRGEPIGGRTATGSTRPRVYQLATLFLQWTGQNLAAGTLEQYTT